MENLDDLIDKNLNLIYNVQDNKMYSVHFVDINGRELTGKHTALQFQVHMENEGLITTDDILCIITRKGFDIAKAGGWKSYLVEKKKSEKKAKKKSHEKENIEFEKTKVDLELAKKMLIEYPKTKWLARAGFFIALVLLIIEIIKLFIDKNPSK